MRQKKTPPAGLGNQQSGNHSDKRWCADQSVTHLAREFKRLARTAHTRAAHSHFPHAYRQIALEAAEIARRIEETSSSW